MVLSGVPHGSVLEPVLFLCYINDMSEMITSMIYMYADDTKLFGRVNDDWDSITEGIGSFIHVV